jgi:hypothetical protein
MVVARNSPFLLLLRTISEFPLIEKSFWTRDKFMFSSNACMIGCGEEIFPIPSHEWMQ